MDTVDVESDTRKTEQISEHSIDNTGDMPAETFEDDVATNLYVELQQSDLLYEADCILDNMTIEEKILQMFILTPEQLTGVGRVTAAGEKTKNCLEIYPIGGIIYLGQNIRDPEQTSDMLLATQAYGSAIEGLPLFLCVDEEGGSISRVAGNPMFNLPQIKPMAEISSLQEAYEAGNTIGDYLADLGFNVNFAPDCDVLTNTNNTIIGNRSFGNDPIVVEDYSKQYLYGLHDNNILGVYKHFPGHGATDSDTHKGLAYTDSSLDEMLNIELIPFLEAQKDGADMVMVSHISVPTILGDYTPCSLSYYMVTKVLRGKLQYDGIVITDAMNMGAITKNYPDEVAAVMAVEAGNDIILVPHDFHVYYNAIKAAVSNGDISEERINDSVRRIICKKLIMRESMDE